MTVKFDKLEHRKDYISADKQVAITESGEILQVGDTVEFDTYEIPGQVTIQSFSMHEKLNEIVAHTDKSTAMITYMYKVEN